MQFNKNIEKRKGTRKRKTGIKVFFLIYFFIIVLVLIWNLLHCGTTEWLTRNAILYEDSEVIYSGDDKIELIDDFPLILHASADTGSGISHRAKLRGVSLYIYENTNQLRFIDEKIHVQIMEEGESEIIAEMSMDLRDQTPRISDDVRIYLPLPEPMIDTLEKDLIIRFSSEGLNRKGVFITGAPTGDNTDDLVVGGLFYENIHYHPFSAILYFLIESIAGLLCLYLYNGKKVPFLEKNRENRGLIAALSESSIFERLTLRRKDCLLFLTALLILMIASSFTYSHVIRDVSISSTADILVGEGDSEEEVTLRPGDVLRQTVAVEQDGLHGIGIFFLHKHDLEEQDTEIEWRILDDAGTTVLDGGTSQLRDLEKVSSSLYMKKQDDEIRKAADDSRILSFSPITEKEEYYTIEIAVPFKGGTSDSEQDSKISLLATADTNGTVAINGEKMPLELCLMGVYDNNGFLKGFYFRMCAVLFILLIVLFIAWKIFSGYPAAMYLVCALSMGMIFSFLTPVYTISDERTHIDSIYTLSNRLLWINDQPGPNRMWRRASDVDASIANTMPVTIDRYRAVEDALFGAVSDSRDDDRGNLKAAYGRESLNNVPILTYLPSAIGFSVARLFGRNLLTMIMAARWMNLITSIILVYFAVKQMPFGGTAMAVTALFPKTLQLMSSCSYDAMIIAGLYVFIAWSLDIAYKEGYYVSDILVILLSGIYLICCKGGAYIPLFGLLLLIPLSKPGMDNKTRRIWKKICFMAIGCVILLFLGLYAVRVADLLIHGAGSITNSSGTRTVYSLTDFIHSPGKLIDIYLNTFHIRGDGILGEMVGKNLSQKWVIVYSFILLALIGAMRIRGEERRFTVSAKALTIGVFACSILLIFLAMLVGFTSTELDYIEGIQGRYLLPVAPLLFLATENGFIQREEGGDTGILYACSFLLTITFLEILMHYLGGV